MKPNHRICLINFVTAFRRRYCSAVSNETARMRRNELFSEEQRRQQSLVSRVDKIEVRYYGVPNDSTLLMNRNMSTPYHCAMHVHESLCQRSALCLVDGQPWDIHRPLVQDCELRMLNFHTDPSTLNHVFWRSCSFLLGMVVEKGFRHEYQVQLHSWPKPSIQSGSYVYDVDVGIPNWKPTSEELKVLTTMLCRLSQEDNNFERLEVSEELALKMFEHSRFKKQQIPYLASDGGVTLYRVKDHIDVSCGPMIANTKFVGTSQVASVHQLDRDTAYRFQAVSIPKQLTLSSFAFGVLVDRAKKLNPIGLKGESCSENINQIVQ